MILVPSKHGVFEVVKGELGPSLRNWNGAERYSRRQRRKKYLGWRW